MKRYSLLLGRMIRWNISPDEPSTFPAIREPEACLLNPLVPIPNQPVPSHFRLSDGRLHLLTDRLDLVAPDDVGPRLLELAPPWLRALRISSRQASLPTEPYGCTTLPVDPKDLKVELPTVCPKATLFGAFRISTALSASAISEAHGLQSDATAPLHQELLLDALQACESRRNRETILYSAIAVESLAKYEIDLAYDAARNASQLAPHLNFMEFALAGGAVTKKDPIYALLTEADNFGRLLHEAPLYLLRRSLLQDSPDLFRQAKSLYGTRNRLGHGQVVEPTDEHLLSVDSRGAKLAVDTAIAVFAWFGKSGYYAPDHTAVEIEG